MCCNFKQTFNSPAFSQKKLYAYNKFNSLKNYIELKISAFKIDKVNKNQMKKTDINQVSLKIINYKTEKIS